MPAGMGWGPYLRFFITATLTAFAGSQTVHLIFRPLDDLEDLVEEELKELRKTLKT